MNSENFIHITPTMSTIFKMKSTFAGITFMILFTLTKTPISESRPIKIRQSELAELEKIWKQACKCLDMMVKMTGAEAQSKGEGIPEEAKKELEILLKVIYVFNMRMEEALVAFFENCTESIEKSEKLQQWRHSLTKAIQKVHKQVRTLCKNIGVKHVSKSSAEKIEGHLDHLRGKCLGLTLCLRNSKIGFEQRFFNMISHLIRGDNALR